MNGMRHINGAGARAGGRFYPRGAALMMLGLGWLLVSSLAGCQSHYDRVLREYHIEPQQRLIQRVETAYTLQDRAVTKLTRAHSQIARIPPTPGMTQRHHAQQVIERYYEAEYLVWEAEKAIESIQDVYELRLTPAMEQEVLAAQFPAEAYEQALTALQSSAAGLRQALTLLGQSIGPTDLALDAYARDIPIPDADRLGALLPPLSQQVEASGQASQSLVRQLKAMP